MRTNVLVEREPVFTHGGAKARKFTPEQELSRAVLCCLLWEDTFYESGEDLAGRIAKLVIKCNPDFVADLAIRARKEYHLRHVPLFLIRELARAKNAQQVESALASAILRPDEIAEFLSLYWKPKKQPIRACVKRGLGTAFKRFNEYSLAKYDLNSSAIKLRDVLRMVHPTPDNDAQSALWKRLTKDELATPDTWETELSAGKDKRATFERLIAEKKLGGLAFLRNLRNMEQSGVSDKTIRDGLRATNFDRVLPFRFIAAAKYASRHESVLQDVMLEACKTLTRLAGKTLLVVDTSGSMGGTLSKQSEMNRIDAAGALAMLAKETCEDAVIYATAGNDAHRKHATMLLPDRHGFAVRDALQDAPRLIGQGGIFLAQCMEYLAKAEKGRHFDRVIVFTDEQDCDITRSPLAAECLGRFNYLMNVATYEPGIGDSNGWVGINGFSERIFDYIAANESEQQ